MTNKRDNLEDSKPWKQAVALVKAVDEAVVSIPHTEAFSLVSPMRQTAIILTSDLANAAGKGDKESDFDYRFARGHLFTVKSLILVAQELGYAKNASSILVQIETLRRLIDGKLDEIEANKQHEGEK